jgi:two-component system NtrC family sensor kinase
LAAEEAMVSGRIAPRIAAIVDRPQLASIEAAAVRLRCELTTTVDRETTVAIVASCDQNEASQRTRRALADGAASVIGVAPERNEAQRLAFFDAGAADVVGCDIGSEELVRRIERLAVLQSWSKSLQSMVADSVQEIDRQRALFQAVIDALPVSLHVIDRQSRIAVWNRGREAGPFGRPRGEVLGACLWDVIGSREDLFHDYQTVLETGAPLVSEVESSASGAPRSFQIEKVPMFVERGNTPSHVLTVSRDVTGARDLERSLAQTEKIAAVGRLAAGIAHEIKNPLATIAGCAEAMQDRLRHELADKDRREIAEDAAVIEGEAYRCKEILEGLLDFSRAETSMLQPTDIGAVARRAVRLLRHNPKVESVNIDLQLGPDLPEPLINEDQMVQVILALVLNAADAAPGGNVTLRAGRQGADHVFLSVEDDGPGVPAEIRARIFEPFFTTKPPGQGTGLGLSVAYGLVKAHGGRLELVSKPGCGACFEIALPCSSEVLR